MYYALRKGFVSASAAYSAAFSPICGRDPPGTRASSYGIPSAQVMSGKAKLERYTALL